MTTAWKHVEGDGSPYRPTGYCVGCGGLTPFPCDAEKLRRAFPEMLTEPDAHPFRWMLDGTPCWCVSADEPHEGWIHAPACQATLRERVALALGALP